MVFRYHQSFLDTQFVGVLICDNVCAVNAIVSMAAGVWARSSSG
jgi:hypothetical protein